MKSTEKFTFFFEELTRVYDGFTRFTISMSVALLGVTGWFLTSSSIDAVLQKPMLAFTAIGVLVLTAVIELFIMIAMIRMFRRLDNILLEAATKIRLDRDHYKHRIFSSRMIMGFYSFHLALMIIIAEMIIQKYITGNSF